MVISSVSGNTDQKATRSTELKQVNNEDNEAMKRGRVYF